MGNRYLRVLKDVGRFALTAFDREDGRGIRVFCKIDAIDAKKTPELKNFFHRTRDEEVQKGGPARELSGEKIMAEFQEVGRSLFGFQKVFVKQHGKPPMLPARVCPTCRESFLARDEQHTRCDVCSNVQEYYVVKG